MRSNRLSSGEAMAVLVEISLERSYWPFGLHDAMIVVLAGSLEINPAFATEMVCCSIASCMAALSAVLILENSSIQHTPSFANTNAPASSVQSFPSRTTLHVRPALVVPIPVVITERALNEHANLRSWDLPHPGSIQKQQQKQKQHQQQQNDQQQQ